MVKGFFEMQTAQDLLGKLNREYAQLQTSPLNQDIAFNFFITAEHISDWLYTGYAPQMKSSREKLRNENVCLQVCSHIANGSKHFKTEAKHHKSVSGMSSKGAFQRNAFQNDAFDVTRLSIDLHEDAAKELGSSSIEVVELAGRILKFWENHMNPTKHP